MAEDYEYDVFVSYRHKEPALGWVKNHFYPLLEQWLPNAMPVEHKTTIFVDWEEIETGAAWPAKLQQALNRSRCLIPVWTPEYFRSDWCLAEWKTMMERERLLGLRTEQKPGGLIYPVVIYDGEHFPKDARNTQQKDLSDWNFRYPHFRDNPAYLDFDKQMQMLVKELAHMIRRAPAWQDWPASTPVANEQVVVKLPRL